ncbi:hypothetical protein [Vibrio coralliilyticus]|uniref:hypothetical protein n=1 Tax=Vibrio coralliilyticus TaxID=190893 RepID=UPI0002DF1F8E|nr:hypothetical protein [Vibrio coralliilyticus]
MLPKRFKIKNLHLVALSFSLVGCSSYPAFEKPAEYTPPSHNYASVSFSQSVGLKGFQYDPKGNDYNLTLAQKLRFTEKEYSVSVFTDHDSCKDQKKINFRRDLRETTYNQLALPKSEFATILLNWKAMGLSCDGLITFPIKQNSSYSVIHEIGIYKCAVFVYDDATGEKVSFYDRRKGKTSYVSLRSNRNFCEPKDLVPSNLVTASYNEIIR